MQGTSVTGHLYPIVAELWGGRSPRRAPSSKGLVVLDLVLVPVVVEERVGAGALDITLDQERAHRVIERDVGRVLDQHPADRLVVGDRLLDRLLVSLLHRGVVRRCGVTTGAVGVRASDRCAPQAVEP